jgi:hypothetical protein
MNDGWFSALVSEQNVKRVTCAHSQSGAFRRLNAEDSCSSSFNLDRASNYRERLRRQI